jgi:Tfp pilus assembly protein PilO
MPVLPGELFDTYRYKLAVTGGYHPVGQFLSNVGSLNRIIAPVTIAIKLHPMAAQTKARVKSGESLIDTQFQVQTYVARTTPYAPATAVK